MTIAAARPKPYASPGRAVVAVGSRSLDKAEAFIRETGLPDAKPVEGYDAVLDVPGLQAVYIPLPTKLHVEWVRKAAAKGLHIVLEKPIAVSQEDLDAMLAAVREAGVVLYDGTMWMHHPRTPRMEAAVAELGGAWDVTSAFTFKGTEDFFKSNVRIKTDADPLGALGDMGWYSVRGILWAFGFEAPEAVQAHAGARFTEQGVPTHVGATLLFSGGRRGRFESGFDVVYTSNLEVTGQTGAVFLRDFVIPREEHEAAFTVSRAPCLVELDTRVGGELETVAVRTELTQEALLWKSFAADVAGAAGGKGPAHWARIAALTQTVLFAILESVTNDNKLVKVTFKED